MAAVTAPTPKLDRYIVIHVATTCDEHGVYVTKDSAEVIELGWILLDSKTCEEVHTHKPAPTHSIDAQRAHLPPPPPNHPENFYLHRESVLVKPVNTPITPLCTSLTTLTWEHVRSAGTFRDAISRFDAFATEHLTSKQLEFAFVTLDSWDLRVQLPREARDKAVVLPAYLQHSRTFDLRTEYQRWQTHHPESLPFGPSSLSNICAALEVEPVQSSAPIKHNLPFHLQALAPASPRRAMEESITLARVLRGLIRKSQPPHEHPEILTRPMDAHADVRAFLAERSKVLHLSGLPHDTTQSELESWFTQFGGRPIAFWTLRTPDQHKPTGTGFAVFSSHEEAAESLCMNGRALNEKAIEVSPSSSRVLDRAADILTPFPPSKNRPRPGDWTCPSCGFSNFQRRTACFRCSFPAMAAAPDPMGYGYGYGPPSMMPAHMGGHGHGGMGHSRGMGGNGGVVPFRAGDWKCGSEGCGYHNFAKNINCLRCGAPRSGAAVVADSAFPSPMDPPSQFSAPLLRVHLPRPLVGLVDLVSSLVDPPNNYALPPGGLGNAQAAYPPMGQVNQGYGSSNTSHSAASFANPATQAAFTGADHGVPSTSASNGAFYGSDGSSDPFAFLSSGIGGLTVSEDVHPRRNGAGANKSPA
ncbi:uncharacterized protein N7483_002904 [Penicillium malachiteum]|uniref:uncharacterized protein n=1 Tax=Penicillium malachiteum TaxID=1324776 RepID=UPI0025479A5C|nr:uncharacterized protein N7483_002904 [Penicillium malachiteum]KAJ5737779.1 hypothetical protein N7483_002904 [Penicillium malachiteum]